jgi:hypothetical protein
MTFFGDGDLLRSFSSREVYIVFGGLKHLFKDSNAFMSMGLEFSAVKVIPDYVLQSIPLGHDVGNFSMTYT